MTGALSVGSTAGHVLAGALLALFTTLFILIDGKRHLALDRAAVPAAGPRRGRSARQAGWITLTTFVKVQIFVAFVDAVGIGLGAFILGLFYGGVPARHPDRDRGVPRLVHPGRRCRR